MEKKYTTCSEQETIELGKRWAEEVADCNVTVALIGDLGAGKTTFVKGVAKGWGIQEQIKSPTFVVMKEYDCPVGKVVHVDAYRLQDDFEDIGLADYFGRAKVLVEWAENIAGVMPDDTICINFRHVDDGREITFNMHDSICDNQ